MPWSVGLKTPSTTRSRGLNKASSMRWKQWLASHGFGNVELVCRDEAKFGSSPQEMARHKAHAIQEHGISVYFESELLQATLNAQSTPTTETIWWSRDAKLRIGGVSLAGWQPR
jgi:hypothetical protein